MHFSFRKLSTTMARIFVSLMMCALLILQVGAELESVLYQHCMDQKQFHLKTNEAYKVCADENVNVPTYDIPACLLTVFGYADKDGFVQDAEQLSKNMGLVYKPELAVNDSITECWTELYKGAPVQYEDINNCLEPIMRKKCFKWLQSKTGESIPDSLDE